MRRILFLLLALTIIASASKGLASTDCEKWLAEYKKELAQKTSVQQALNARERARRYAKRQVGHLISPAAAPKPHPLRVSTTRPHLTPAQMLKRFDLLCGELPIDSPNQVLDGRMSPDEFISEMSMGGPVDTETMPGDNTLIATEDAPPYTPGEVSSGKGGTVPVWPIYGPVPSGGSYIAPLSSPPPVLVPVSSVPEPNSLVLMLTGALGAGVGIRRRLGRP